MFLSNLNITKSVFEKIFTLQKEFRKDYQSYLKKLIRDQTNLTTRIKHSALLLQGKGANVNLICNFRKNRDKRNPECATRFRCGFQFSDFTSWFVQMEEEERNERHKVRERKGKSSAEEGSSNGSEEEEVKTFEFYVETWGLFGARFLFLVKINKFPPTSTSFQIFKKSTNVNINKTEKICT
jgi:hypothetical protein